MSIQRRIVFLKFNNYFKFTMQGVILLIVQVQYVSPQWDMFDSENSKERV